MESHLFDISNDSANFTKSDLGSDPADKTKIRGVSTEESLKHFSKLKTGGMINY